MKTRKRSSVNVVRGLTNALALVGLAALATLTTGCLERELKPLNPCLVSGVTAKIAVTNVDKVDILFMVDNSNSMREEQDALKAQFPKLIQTLTSGKRSPTDPNPFPAAKDLHLAVVSSDMGLVGVNGVKNCTGFGNDGIMFDPAAKMCPGGIAGQRFLSYKADTGTATQVFADNFGCLANLGTGGCGFEQQLESTLKALWPKTDIDAKTGKQWVNPMTNMPDNRITFLKDATGAGAFGHGDVENRGFLRNSVQDGLSLVAVILVTDEEDCSASNTDHFKLMSQLSPGDPNLAVDLNLRCFSNPQNLYKISERYVPGFKALRESNPNLVIYAAITGVPPELVNEAARAGVDFSNKGQRDAYYDGILASAAMQNMVDPTRQPGDGNLRPSCDTATGKAYPPRRLVEMAREFGENSVIQSICQADFAPAMDAIIEVIAKQLGAVCLPKPLVPKSDGKVGCNVVWELPPPGMAQNGTPTACGGMRPFLLAPPADRAQTNDRSGNNCTVAQLPADRVMKKYLPDPETKLMQGWYYDDFTPELAKECSPTTPQRIAFTLDAKPPTGVVVKLECLNEIQTLISNRTDLADIPQPEIGTPCTGKKDAANMPITGDQFCTVTLRDGTPETKMFCHPELNVCVKSCTSATDCPSAWVCDDRGDTLTSTSGPNRLMGSPICVNPTCGSN